MLTGLAAGILMGPFLLFGHYRMPFALLILDELFAKAAKIPVSGFRQGAYTAFDQVGFHGNGFSAKHPESQGERNEDMT